MPKLSKIDAPDSMALEGYEGHFGELDGYTVGFESYPEDVDPASLFQGLPDDRCQCPHWGVVQTGQITFRWVDNEETYGAGDAYYAGPGHLPLIAAGTSLVEFSPSDSLQQTMAVIEANLATAGDAR